MRRLLCSAVVAVFASIAGAQPTEGFERILLPGHTTAPLTGTAGTTFHTELHALSDEPFRYLDGNGAIQTQPAGTTLFAYGFNGPVTKGRFFFVEQPAASRMTFGYALTSTPAGGGARTLTTLPVVRESESKRGVTRILLVPFSYILDGLYPQPVPRFRRTLRVYSFEDGPGSVAVRVYHSRTTPPLRLRELTLPIDRRDGSGPTFPWYGELALEDICLPFSAHTPCISFDGLVELEPADDSLRYYPIISATDNVTQYVTVRTAQ